MTEQLNYLPIEKTFSILCGFILISLFITFMIFLATEIEFISIKKYLIDIALLFIMLILLSILIDFIQAIIYSFSFNEVYSFNFSELLRIDWILVIGSLLFFLITNIQIILKRNFKINIIGTIVISFVALIIHIVTASEKLSITIILDDYINYMFITYFIVSIVYLISYGISVCAMKRKNNKKVEDSK